MNPLLLALPIGAYFLWKRENEKGAAGPVTPSGVPVGTLPHVPLLAGAEKYLPPLNVPEAIRNTYANAWAAKNAAYVGVAAQQLRALGYVDLAAALENRAAKLSAAAAAAPTPTTSGACGALPGFGRWFMPRAAKRQMLVKHLRANPALALRLKKKLKRRRIVARMRRDPAFALKLKKLVLAKRARKTLHPNLAQHLARIRRRPPQRKLLIKKLARNPNLFRKLVRFKQLQPGARLRMNPNLAQLANMRRVRRRPGIRSSFFR